MKFFKPDLSFRQCVDELILFSRFYPIRSPQMIVLHQAVSNPFLKEGIGLLLEGILDEKAFHRVLRARMETYHRVKFHQVDQLKFLSYLVMALTFPIVLVCLLKGSYASAGWSVLISAFVTYGVMAPIGHYLKKKTLRERTMNEAIVHGLHLISAKVNPIVISEELNSYLPVDQRIPWVAVALTSAKKAA